MQSRPAPLLAAFVAVLGGCATPSPIILAPADLDARSLPIFGGHDQQPVPWSTLLAAIEAADVVILGEEHTDGVGHAVQLALVEDALAAWPGTALSLEMLERDDQDVVDDYLEGIVEAGQLASLTLSSNWAGGGTWEIFYQPIIEAARAAGSPVIAANAPRRYVRLARREGYERLDDLPPQRLRLIERPLTMPDDAYHRRFVEVMTPAHEDGEEEAAPDETDLEALYRAQVLWDTTMAASIAAARAAGAPRVIHLVGHFHCDFDGGLVQQLRTLDPGVRVLVITMLSKRAAALEAEDVGRADFVVYSGM